MSLYTTYHHSPLGLLKIQCDEAVISAITFLQKDEKGPQDENPLLKNCMQQLDEFFSGTRKDFTFPMLQTGTPFQEKVWQLLSQIPYGKTISYNTLSKQYGDPKAIRAVASANGKNKLAIVVPCHRVIGSNQTLTGYAGGIWRKKWLLEHEAKFHSGVQQLGLEM